MNRKGLTDRQWDRIKDLVPGKASDCGVTGRDNRLFLDAVLWLVRVPGTAVTRAFFNNPESFSNILLRRL